MVLAVWFVLAGPAAAQSDPVDYREEVSTRIWITDYPQYQPVGGVLLQAPGLAPNTPNPPDLYLFGGQGKTSFATISLPGTLKERHKAWAENKPKIMAAQRRLLDARYDFSGRTHPTARMSGGKPIAVGPVARLGRGVGSWEELGALTPDEVRARDLFPFKPLPHPLQSSGGMVLPDGQSRQLGGRVDVDFDIPDAYIPEFPPPLFLTTRPDLGDVSQGQLIQSENLEPLLGGILTGEQLNGVILCQVPFHSSWQNQSDHSAVGERGRDSEGMRCLECHPNGHTNGAIALDPGTRPQMVRARLDTPTMRGLALQGPLSLKRTLQSSIHFGEAEEYFDSDPALGEAIGPKRLKPEMLRKIEAFLNIIALPPAPKLDVFGRLYPAKATLEERRGEALFFGKAKCAVCHPAPLYSDNQMHDLRVERFYKGRAEGAAKTFPLRGIKDSPPYFHDGRLPTLEDTVEFFDLVMQTRLGKQEKADLAEFLRAL